MTAANDLQMPCEIIGATSLVYRTIEFILSLAGFIRDMDRVHEII